MAWQAFCIGVALGMYATTRRCYTHRGAMLGIDIALLLASGALVVVAAAFVGGRIGARGEARRRRLQGKQNAEEEKRRLEERCAVCGAAIDPAQDIWDAGQWWHRACYREAVR